MKPIRLMSGFFTVGVWTLLSRVLGFLREVLLLSLIGPGPVMDAFVAAFRLPNMFRRFFAEGAFNAAFVPMFAKKLEGEEGAGKFARDAFNGLALVVLALTALGMIFMPGLVWLTAEGFVGDPRFDMTVAFGRIAFPYILCMSLSALFSVWTLFGAREEFAQSLLDDLAAQDAAADMTVESTQSMVTVMLVVTVFVVLGFGALFLFWVKRMRAGKMWARMLLTVIGSFTVFTTILELFSIASSAGAMNIVMSVLGIGQGVLAAGAIYLMHRRESNEYFVAASGQR